MNVYPVLMAGGVGTRFWPLSRKSTPKQLLNISGQGTMIQMTYQRLLPNFDPRHIFVVTNQAYADAIQAHLPELPPENFILEPLIRNTAPCISLAALHIAAHDPEGIMLALPADHTISDLKIFYEVIDQAITYVHHHNGLVTLGIPPTEPATGYGYIQAGKTVHQSTRHSVHKVRTFAEKPNLETAERFLESGDFYWNSGIFIWKANTILQEIQDKLPYMHDSFSEVQKHLNTPHYDERLREAYRHIRGISIDFGVMQYADNVFVIPAEMGWRDVGSWDTIYDISPKDKYQNVLESLEWVSIRSKNNLVYSPEKLVAMVDVDDLIVVDTGDALLICKKSSAQDVSDIADHLKKKGFEKWI